MRIARLRTIRAEAFDQTDATRESDILILFLGSTNSISPSLQLSAVANLLNAFPADLRGFSEKFSHGLMPQKNLSVLLELHFESHTVHTP